MSALSAGACTWLNEAPADELEELHAGCAVQLLHIRQLPHTQATRTLSTKDRYRVVLSDGVHFVFAMLASQLNDHVHLGDIVKYAVVVLDKVTCSYVYDKRILIILDLHVIASDVQEEIGNPIAVPVNSGTPASASN